MNCQAAPNGGWLIQGDSSLGKDVSYCGRKPVTSNISKVSDLTKEMKWLKRTEERERLSNLDDGCNSDPDMTGLGLLEIRERRLLLCIY